MVESNSHLDAIFGALSDPIRRDILRRGAKRELSIGEMAECYDVTLAAISKHVIVLEKAKLVMKRRDGKKQLITLKPQAFNEAAIWLKHYEKLWNDRLDSLERYLTTL